VAQRVRGLSSEEEEPPQGTTPELWGQQVLFSLAETATWGHMFGALLAEDDRIPLEDLLPEGFSWKGNAYTTSNLCPYPGWPWAWREALCGLLRDVEADAVAAGAKAYRSRTEGGTTL